MEKVLERILYFGPLIFAFGFLAPLIDQTLVRLNWSAPLGLSSLQFALGVAGVLGLIAQVRGRWL